MVFIGINFRELVSQIDDFIEQTGFTHPILRDITGETYIAYNLNGGLSPFPLDYIIDRDGTIVYGQTEYSPLDMRVTLDVLLAQSDAPEVTPALPRESSLSVYPNPFNAESTILIEVVNPGRYRVDLFNVLGQRLHLLWEGEIIQSARIPFDASGEFQMSSGTYFIRATDLTRDQAAANAKVILLK